MKDPNIRCENCRYVHSEPHPLDAKEGERITYLCRRFPPQPYTSSSYSACDYADPASLAISAYGAFPDVRKHWFPDVRKHWWCGEFDRIVEEPDDE